MGRKIQKETIRVYQRFMTIFALVSFFQFLRWGIYHIQGRDLQEKETAAVVFFLQKTSAFCNERNILPYIST
jgi:hypothetical protein